MCTTHNWGVRAVGSEGQNFQTSGVAQGCSNNNCHKREVEFEIKSMKLQIQCMGELKWNLVQNKINDLKNKLLVSNICKRTRKLFAMVGLTQEQAKVLAVKL